MNRILSFLVILGIACPAFKVFSQNSFPTLEIGAYWNQVTHNTEGKNTAKDTLEPNCSVIMSMSDVPNSPPSPSSTYTVNGSDTITSVASTGQESENPNSAKSISKIYLKIGSSSGSGDLFTGTFLPGNTASVPAGSQYKIHAGKHYMRIYVAGLLSYSAKHYSIQLENSNGNLSSPVLGVLNK